MATSPVRICNSALIKIGAERISSLTDNNKRAIACNEQYETLRDEVLSAHPWSFAKKRAQLGLLSTSPAWGFTAQFQLPNDCLRVLETSNGDQRFKIEAGLLLADFTSCSILYIRREDNVTLYSATFVEALACRLAADISYLVAQSNSVQESMMTAYKAQLAQARTMNAQEGSADSLQAHDWLRSRF